MSDKGILQFIALEIAVLIAMLAYAGYQANQAIVKASSNPLVNLFSGL